MEIYDVINAINTAVKDDIQGHYVLHRNMEVQPVKIYKKFSYRLYLIKGSEKELVLVHQHITRLPNTDIEKIWIEEDKQFLIQLLTWFKYGKLKNESFPDSSN